MIGKELKHKNIVDFKYFMHKKVKNQWEFHLILELPGEKNMRQFLKDSIEREFDEDSFEA